MVNVRHRVCQHEGCGTEGTYNRPGQQQVPLFFHILLCSKFLPVSAFV